MNSSIAGYDNKTVVEGSTFDLPDMQFSSKDKTCTPYEFTQFRVHSFGFLNGEVPFFFPFPTLMFQILCIMVVTRFLHFLLRPLRQPRIVCNVIGGILLSPGVLGLIKISGEDETGHEHFWKITEFLFPTDYFSLIHTIAGFGIMFHLFLAGVKIDPKMILHSGRKAWVIGTVSFIAPFFSFSIVCYTIDSHIITSKFFVFVVASISVTSFPDLADILTDFQLLNSELGRLAMSSAMVHGVFGFVFMAAFIAINQGQGDWAKSVLALLSLAAVIVIIVFVFRPWMLWIIRHTPRGRQIEEKHIFAILITVIAMGVVSDLIGASWVFAPFVMGLAVPDGPPLGAALVEKVQLLAGDVMVSLLFSVSGMSATLDVFIQWRKTLLRPLVLMMAYLTKLLGTMVSAMQCRIPVSDAFLLGLMMNFRGLCEILTLLHFKNGALFNDESYTSFLLTSVLGTCIAVPLVSILYKPMRNSYNLGRRTIQQFKPHTELRLLLSMRNEKPIPSIINLLEASSPMQEMPLCVYTLHLTELVGRASSHLIAHKNRKGIINPSQMDRLHNVFIKYEQSRMGQVTIQPFTAITPIKTMYQDVCSLAAEKNVALIVVPFNRNHGAAFSDYDSIVRSNITAIQEQASCSVGILVYPDTLGGRTPVSGHFQRIIQASGEFQHQIGILFWGGPDDREALAYASRMARRTGVSLTVIHFMLTADRRDIKEQKLDDNLLASIQYENAHNDQFVIEKVVVKDAEQTIQAIRSTGRGYDLLLVGRKQGDNSLLDERMAEWSEFPELGVVGDMLASNDFECSSCMLVMQQPAGGIKY